MPIKLLGLALLFAAWLLHRGIKRARHRGYVGPARRRVYRDEQRLQFRVALASQALGALICCLGAYLCLAGALAHHF